MAHEHDWLEITAVGDSARHFACGGCNERKTVALPGLADICEEMAEAFGFAPFDASNIREVSINGVAANPNHPGSDI